MCLSCNLSTYSLICLAHRPACCHIHVTCWIMSCCLNSENPLVVSPRWTSRCLLWTRQVSCHWWRVCCSTLGLQNVVLLRLLSKLWHMKRPWGTTVWTNPTPDSTWRCLISWGPNWNYVLTEHATSFTLLFNVQHEWIIWFFLFFLFVQLIDLSQIFLSTEIEFLQSALGQPGGSVRAVCVPSGAVRTEPFPVAENAENVEQKMCFCATREADNSHMWICVSHIMFSLL